MARDRRAITLDAEFADEGGEGPTPYEVLLHAALVGDSGRFKRQDVVNENWRIMQPLIDNPPPVHPYAQGSWGPEAGAALVADHGGWQGPWIVRVAEGGHAMSLDSSPFPPIADYAFLSDCHTGALIAPDGSVDWLCVPAFDSPSAFGNLLDRGAGSFRFGPYGINVPNHRSYVPGTNVLTTTWHTPSGWLLVHDALTMGPRQGPDLVTPHTQAPGRR